MELVPPRFDAPIDLDAHLALLPKDGTCKGLFFNVLFDAARGTMSPEALSRRAEIEDRRYWTFSDYPVGDCLRLMVATAQVVWPRRPVGEGIRRLGMATYESFLGSQIGRVVFGALGVDVHMIMKYGPKALQVSLSFGKHHNERIDERTWHSHYEGLPIFVETHQVGILEGMLVRCGVEGRVRVHMTNLADAVIETTIYGPAK